MNKQWVAFASLPQATQTSGVGPWLDICFFKSWKDGNCIGFNAQEGHQSEKARRDAWALKWKVWFKDLKFSLKDRGCHCNLDLSPALILLLPRNRALKCLWLIRASQNLYSFQFLILLHGHPKAIHLILETPPHPFSPTFNRRNLSNHRLSFFC